MGSVEEGAMRLFGNSASEELGDIPTKEQLIHLSKLDAG